LLFHSGARIKERGILVDLTGIFNQAGQTLVIRHQQTPQGKDSNES